VVVASRLPFKLLLYLCLLPQVPKRHNKDINTPKAELLSHFKFILSHVKGTLEILIELTFIFYQLLGQSITGKDYLGVTGSVRAFENEFEALLKQKVG